MKSIRDSKQLYWGLIITFFVLYFCVGFVSTLHSITFFELANAPWMAAMLGITYEVGQASVLFSILMTKNSQKILPWALMILLTALQVTANVYASFKFMDASGSTDWTFWQRSILFWMETDDPEMFKVVISWITGALLPIVALGMTALVAENLKMKDEENQDDSDEENKDDSDDSIPPDGFPPTWKDPKWEKDFDEVKSETPMEDYVQEQIDNDPRAYDEISKHVNDTILKDLNEIRNRETAESEIELAILPTKTEQLNNFAEELLKPKNELKFPEGTKTPLTPGVMEVVKQPIEINLDPGENAIDPDDWRKIQPDKNWGNKPEIDIDSSTIDFPKSDIDLFPKKPINNKRGWHLQKEFIDDNGDVYIRGQFQEGQTAFSPVPKKA